MRAVRVRRWLLVVSALTLCFAAPAAAQDDEAEESAENPEQGDTGEYAGSEAEGEETEGGEGEAKEGEPEVAAAPAAARKWFFGPYFRYQFVPAFMLGLFLAETPTVGNVAFGAAANYRPDPEGAKFEMGLGYAAYSFEDAFRISGDPREDTEWLKSDLGMIHVTGSILWDTQIVKNLTFEYGIGLDFGIVTGEIVRNEASYVDSANQWVACTGIGAPNIFYCEPPQFGATDGYDEDGAHYDVVEERVPPVAAIPMLPHLALRYAFIPEVAAKFEVAYGIFQISLGLSVAYAPEL